MFCVLYLPAAALKNHVSSVYFKKSAFQLYILFWKDMQLGLPTLIASFSFSPKYSSDWKQECNFFSCFRRHPTHSAIYHSTLWARASSQKNTLVGSTALFQMLFKTQALK